MSNLKIFISSTFIDLSESRSELRRWIQGLFNLDLVVMETFGSDSAPPEINSVRRVRECDFFIGIYAHRYGTIDGSSGKSITELEFDEAQIAYSQGTLKDVLIYIINSNSLWLSEFKETKSPQIECLERLKSKVKNQCCPI